MIKKTLKKNALLSLTKVLSILFISLLVSACPSNQQASKQKLILQDSINTDQIQTKKKLDSIVDQEKKETEKVFVKPKAKAIKIISSSLPDFTTYKNVKQKKSAFFSFLMPLVQNENISILNQRQFILEQYQIFKSKDTLSIENSAVLNKYISNYRCRNNDLGEAKTFDELLIRVDIIPQELALVQAALESSWGSSYFARVANNLFGQWCFKPGCGIVPRARKEGETHEVAKFKTLQLGVKSYMLLLNSHPAYSLLRKERSSKREKGEKPEALTMVNGLKAYSARGDAYIREVKSMIRTNREFLIAPTEKDNVLSVLKGEKGKSN